MMSFEDKMELIDNMSQEVVRLSDKVQLDFSICDNKIEALKKEIYSCDKDTNDRFNKLYNYQDRKVDLVIKDSEFLKKHYQAFEKEYRDFEYYQTKVQPIKESAFVFNILHQCIRDKDGYNNLVE